MSSQQEIRHEQLLSPEDNGTATIGKETVRSEVVARSGATTKEEETADEHESLEDRAIRFLLHSSLSDLNLGQKLSFLETKGFTPLQIQSILEEVQHIQRRHLEDTFEKTFDHVAMPSKISNTNSHPSSSNNNQRHEYYQPHRHQQQLYQQPSVSENTNGDTSSKATVIGMFGGLVATVGMASWRWINGGDFELFPPPRIIQDSSDYLDNKSNADIAAHQSYNHEDEEDGEYSANDASAINPSTKNFTNNAMDFLIRNQLDADSKMDESNHVELPLQEQLVSLDVKLTHLLDSITSAEPLPEHGKETMNDKSIATIKQMKLLLSSILLEPNNNKDVVTNKSANDDEDSTPDLQEAEAIFIEGKQPIEIPNGSEDHTSRTSIASTNDEPKIDAELPQEVDEQETQCQSTTAALHTENNEIEPTITLSCCKDDTIFADALLKLCRQWYRQENIHNVDVSTTISTIYMYCNNIVKHNKNSNNKKYCKVNTNNAMFQKYIQQVPGAIEVLESLGFAMVKDDKATFYTMEWNQPIRWINAAADDTQGADTDETWNDGIMCLKKVCEELQAVKEQLTSFRAHRQRHTTY